MPGGPGGLACIGANLPGAGGCIPGLVIGTKPLCVCIPGTIEMPKGVTQSGGLQEIRNCIRRLRVEKKVHTLVLFCIFPSQVVLINHHGLKLAVFLAENIQ